MRIDKVGSGNSNNDVHIWWIGEWGGGGGMPKLKINLWSYFSAHWYIFLHSFRGRGIYLVTQCCHKISNHRHIRLTQCCTQFKSPGFKILCVLYLHYNVAFIFKWYGNTWNKTFYSQRVWIGNNIDKAQWVYCQQRESQTGMFKSKAAVWSVFELFSELHEDMIPSSCFVYPLIYSRPCCIVFLM